MLIANRQICVPLLTWVQPLGQIFGLGVLCMVMTAATEPLFTAPMKHLLDSGLIIKDLLDIRLILSGIFGVFIISAISNCASGDLMAWVTHNLR
jgi:subfamily B ATP-binding cassette protein MsbA